MYLSLVTANRLDGYGSNQVARIKLHVEYLREFTQRYWTNLKWEYVVVDYNPPSKDATLSRSKLFEGIDNIRFIEVEQENVRVFDLHLALNLGVKHSKGKFIVITNFDIFLDREIYEFISLKEINSKTSYYADRYDLNWDESKLNLELLKFKSKDFSGLHGEGIVQYRHGTDESLQFATSTSRVHGSRIRWFENQKRKIALSPKYLKWLIKIYKKLQISKKTKSQIMQDVISKLSLHTNASGDFILVSKEMFQKVGGFNTSLDNYWHKDSELLLRLISVGVRHGTFIDGIKVYHLLSDFSGGKDNSYQESKSFEELTSEWIDFF
jgi:hypothetical protein